jgi:hypothetical protein
MRLNLILFWLLPANSTGFFTRPLVHTVKRTTPFFEPLLPLTRKEKKGVPHPLANALPTYQLDINGNFSRPFKQTFRSDDRKRTGCNETAGLIQAMASVTPAPTDGRPSSASPRPASGI